MTQECRTVFVVREVVFWHSQLLISVQVRPAHVQVEKPVLPFLSDPRARRTPDWVAAGKWLASKRSRDLQLCGAMEGLNSTVDSQIWSSLITGATDRWFKSTVLYFIFNTFRSFLSWFREACYGSDRLVSPPWLPVSGLPVSVWVSSCRLFVDCAGRLRGGGVGVGVKRTADSCYGLRLSFLISSVRLHLLAASAFSTCTWCPPLAVKIPPQWWRPHTLLSVLLSISPLRPPVVPFYCL